MPFNPNIPATRTKLRSAEMRDQFNALKALIDDLAAQVVALSDLVPVGGIVAWAKNSFNTMPALPAQFMECNGQVVNDPASPLNGETLPNLNGENRFLRGAALSGNMGGNETHQHGFESGDTAAAGSDVNVAVNQYPGTTEAGNLPPYYEVVWLMRVK